VPPLNDGVSPARSRDDLRTDGVVVGMHQRGDAPLCNSSLLASKMHAVYALSVGDEWMPLPCSLYVQNANVEQNGCRNGCPVGVSLTGSLFVTLDTAVF
jgi:hypothetical protein